MRIFLFPLGLCFLPACLVPPGNPINADISIDAASQYNRRGMPQNKTGVLQPAVALRLPTVNDGTLTLSTWGNMDLQDDVGHAWYPDGNALRFSEIDYIGTYTKRYGQTDVSAGLHNYNIPRGDRFPFGVRGATVEVFGRGEYDLQNGWFPFAELRVDIDESEGFYGFVGFAKQIPLREQWILEAETTVAYIDSKQAFWEYAVKESGLADWRVTAKLFYQFDDATRFTLLGAFSSMIGDSVGGEFRDDFDNNAIDPDNAWLSTGVTWSY
ncbi:MAG TPA: hypothetical protein VM509_11295 [Planctomycetota bacterium]|nr:hypothetical protein [Planctomycetota bacterium]